MRLTLLFSLLLLTACATAPRPSPQPPTLPDIPAIRAIGTLELPVFSGNNAPRYSLPEGILVERLSTGFSDVGGTRYLSVSLRIRNGTNRRLENLALRALTPAGAVGGSALTDLRDPVGTPITDAQIACTMRPTHSMTDRQGVAVILPADASLQAYTEAETAQFSLPDRRILPYGFAARTIAGRRSIAAGEDALVTVALKYPYDPVRPIGYPFSFTMHFVVTEENNLRFTRAFEETSAAFEARVRAYFAPNAVPADLTLALLGEEAFPANLGTPLPIGNFQICNP